MARSTKGETKSFNPGIKKFDLKPSINNGRWLPYELVHARLADCAAPVVIGITPMRSGSRLAIDQEAESRRISTRSCAHDQMKIACVKSVHDAPSGLVKYDGFLMERPVT